MNLAAGAGLAVDELFDPFAAIILLGLTWILEGGADGSQPGLQPYPASLEREIAELSLGGSHLNGARGLPPGLMKHAPTTASFSATAWLARRSPVKTDRRP